MWANTFGEIYSVIGNHELSYYSSNPFYTLVSDIESDKVQSILNRVWQPVGSAGVIKVVDSLEDGEVLFHFNHFGTTIAKPVVGKHNIGLFHQDIVNSEILNNSAENLDYQCMEFLLILRVPVFSMVMIMLFLGTYILCTVLSKRMPVQFYAT